MVAWRPGSVMWVALAACSPQAPAVAEAVSVQPPAAQVPTPLPPLKDAGAWEAEEAARIVARSRAAYRACARYEDEGTCETWNRGYPDARTRVDFHTAFAGPHAVRFAYRETAPPMGVTFGELVSDASGTTVTPPEEVRRHVGSLDEGLGTLSQWDALAVLPLLRVGLAMRSTLDVEDLRLTGWGVADGAACDVIDGYYRRGRHVQVWIARTDSLIRRVVQDTAQTVAAHRETVLREREELGPYLRDAGASEDAIAHGFEYAMHLPPRSTFSATTFHPRCNQPIADEALRASDAGL